MALNHSPYVYKVSLEEFGDVGLIQILEELTLNFRYLYR